MPLANDYRPLFDKVTNLDAADFHLGGRRIAPIGHEPLRAANGRRAVAALRLERPLAAAPKPPRLLLLGGRRARLLGLRAAQRLGERQRRQRLLALLLADLEDAVVE